MKKIVILSIIFLFLLSSLYILLSAGDYYEYQANSAEECLSGEEYDQEYGVCYFDFYCETEVQCEAVDEKYGEVLDALALEYESSEHDHHEQNSKAESDSQNLDTDTVSQTETIRDIMQAIVPKQEMKKIVEIVADSDGPDGTLAYVEPTREDGAAWKMAYDPADSFNRDQSLKNPQELLTTLIHEYAHVLTLNDEQVEHIGSEVEYIQCAENEVILDEGCGKEQAYLSLFVKDFWPESLREQTREAMQEGREEVFAYELYDAKPDHYVTEYAATNETEDFAESFALFVMRSEKPNDTIVKNQKIRFFYSFPELVAMRSHMRGGLLKVLQTQ